MKLVIAATIGAALLAAGCENSGQPVQSAPSSERPSTVAAPTSTTTPPRRDVSGVDACALLTAADLRPILADTPPSPRRQDGVACAWGDGEFRGVWLTLAGTARPELRKVDVGGRRGAVVEEAEYTCGVEVDVDGVHVALRAVATDKTDWCVEAAAALAAATARLP